MHSIKFTIKDGNSSISVDLLEVCHNCNGAGRTSIEVCKHCDFQGCVPSSAGRAIIELMEFAKSHKHSKS